MSSPRIVITTELIARGPHQTDLVYREAQPRSLKDRLILQAIEGQFRTAVARDSATLIEFAAADAAERAVAAKRSRKSRRAPPAT